MKSLLATSTAALTLALGGAATAQDVTVDWDRAANFAAIKTFSLKLETPWGNPLGEKRLTEEITQALVDTEGTLIVDIYEAKSKQLVWRGVAQGELKDKPEKREKQLQKATDKLFKDFPPGSAKK